MKIEVQATQDLATFTVEHRSIFDENIREYQGTGTAPSNIIVGLNSAIIRLGRLEDMFMIAGFAIRGNNICGKHLMCQLRDGHNIRIESIGRGEDGGRDLYGITYGRNGDLYNVFGFRDSDFNFVFDPREPRTGRNRNPNTVVQTRGELIVVDKGCK